VKGTEGLNWLRSGRRASFRLARVDLVGWLRELLPVILIVYDAKEDRAYWLHVQAYFAAQLGFSLFTAGATVTVHLDASQVLDPGAIRTFAALRDVAER
jgi:mannose/fructose/N-acetylgalactosamine-specific phosphotransferase system component IID